MKVVALKSFFGTTGNIRIGAVVDVADKIGNSWVKTGLVRVAEKSDEDKPAKAIETLDAPAPVAPADDESDESEPTTDEPTGDQPDVEADKEPETGNADEVETPAPAPNTNPNQAKKAGK